MRYFIVIFLYTFDAAHIISYFIMVILILMVIYNEEWYAKMYPIFHKLFLSEINSYIND